MSKILNTRDLDKKLDELKSDYENLQENMTEIEEAIAENENGLPRGGQKEDLEEAQKELKDFEESEEYAELKELENMESEISEWSSGEQLIPEGYFTDYCKELLKDIGDIPKDLPGYIIIDWGQTAKNLKADYSEIEYQGEIYLCRCY